MALIKCSKCGKEVSENSKACPNCGFPIKSNLKKEKIIDGFKFIKSIVNNKIFICLSIVIGLYLFYCAYDCAYSPIYWSDTESIMEPTFETIILLIFAIPVLYWGLTKLKIARKFCYIVITILFMPCPIMLGIGYNLVETNMKDESNLKKITHIDKERFTTIENVQKNLDGTVWTWTEPLRDKDLESYKFWKRFEFKNNKLYIQTAAPSKGEWGEATEHNYKVEEKRNVNTGKKIIVVLISEMEYFVPATGFYVQPYMMFGITEHTRNMRENDYSWD